MFRKSAFAVGLLVVLWICAFAQPCKAVESEDFGPAIQVAIEQYQAAFEEKEFTQRVALFRKAEIAFASVLGGENLSNESDVHFSADLYTGWGNSALQSGNLGIAVFAFRRALAVDPFHEQARKNLEFVRLKLPAWTQTHRDNSFAVQQIFFWSYWFDQGSIQLISAIFFLVGSLLLAIVIHLKKMVLVYPCAISFFI